MEVAGASKHLKSWFNNEVFYMRCAECVAWIVAFQLFTTFIVSLFLNFSIYPHIWLKNTVVACFSLTTATTFFIATIVMLLAVFSHTCMYSVSPHICTTRASMVWNVLKLSHLTMVLMTSLSSAVIVRFYLSMAGEEFGSLMVKCDNESKNDKQCLNERHEIVVLHAAFIGLVFGLHYFVYDVRYVPFPVVQQPKFIQIKQSVISHVLKSAVFAITHMKWFAALYCLAGPAIVAWISSHLPLESSPASHWSTVLRVVNFRLWWMALLTSTAIVFLYREVIYIFRVFQTEMITFLIETPFIEDKTPILHQALNCQDIPLLQCLGFMNLSYVAQFSSERRKEIFSLSQPGGHPHNWNQISAACTVLIESITDKLNPSRNVSRQIESKSIVYKMADTSEFLAANLSSGLPSPNESSYISQNVSPPVYSSPIFRSPFEKGKDIGGINSSLHHQQSPIIRIEQYWRTKKHRVWGSLLNIRPVGYLFKDLNDATKRQIFATCQPVIWALEGLSFLIAASYKEDNFGVVQRDLVKLLTVMFDLQHALEIHQKKDTAGIRHVVQDSLLLTCNSRLRVALRSALTAAIYRIVMVFGLNLSVLRLPSEHKERLNRYLELRQ